MSQALPTPIAFSSSAPMGIIDSAIATPITPSTLTYGNLYKKPSSNALYWCTNGGGEVSLTPATGSAVTGPASSTDTALVRFNGTSGGVLQNSSVTLSNAGIFSSLDTSSYVNTATQYQFGGVKFLFQTLNNVALGSNALPGLTSGNNNIAIGASAGSTLAGGSSNIIIGSAANVPAAGTSGSLIIGPSVTGNGSNTATINTNGTTNQGLFTNYPRVAVAPGTLNVVGFNSTTNELVSTSTLVSAISSKRFKENIRSFDCDIFDKLRPVQYIYNQACPVEYMRGTYDVGLIAEELNEIYPHAVTYEEDGQVHGIDYKKLIIPLIVEVKKLRKRVEDLENMNC